MSLFAAARPKASVLDAVEGFYLANILNHFHRIGLLDKLRDDQTVKQLAESFDYSSEVLGALLEFLVQRSEVVTRSAGKYVLAQTFTDDYYVGFQLDKFVGSYGPAVTGLSESLRRKFPGRSLVDRVVESEAYDRIGSPPNPIVLAVMESLGPATMLDLGCGPGTTLAALAQRDSRFRGWGVDVVAAMCVVARARIDELGLSEQIEIIHHDGRDLVTALPLDLRDRVDVLHCKGILNEFFGRGDEHAIDYLRQVRDLFPDRLLINVDYYGKLGRMDVIPSEYRHTVLHDVIQVLTRQGVPPRDRAGWASVYEAAGAKLEHAFEGDDSGIEWFVHVVRL